MGDDKGEDAPEPLSDEEIRFVRVSYSVLRYVPIVWAFIWRFISVMGWLLGAVWAYKLGLLQQFLLTRSPPQ
jgi:hypothetical protein